MWVVTSVFASYALAEAKSSSVSPRGLSVPHTLRPSFQSSFIARIQGTKHFGFTVPARRHKLLWGKRGWHENPERGRVPLFFSWICGFTFTLWNTGNVSLNLWLLNYTQYPFQLFTVYPPLSYLIISLFLPSTSPRHPSPPNTTSLAQKHYYHLWV